MPCCRAAWIRRLPAIGRRRNGQRGCMPSSASRSRRRSPGLHCSWPDRWRASLPARHSSPMAATLPSNKRAASGRFRTGIRNSGAGSLVQQPCSGWNRTDPALEAESHHSLFIDGPCRIPCDFPGVVVGVGHVAAEASVRRRVSFPDYAPACLYQLLHDGDDVVLCGNVMGQRECTGHRKPCAAHILFKGRLAECAENETVHLVEDDLLILEDRRPTKAFHIKPAGAGQVGDAKRNDGNLLLHVQVLCSLRMIA